MEQKGFFYQDKKVLVADPDVLSFSVVDHKMQFAGILIIIATNMTLIYNIIFLLTIFGAHNIFFSLVLKTDPETFLQRLDIRYCIAQYFHLGKPITIVNWLEKIFYQH